MSLPRSEHEALALAYLSGHASTDEISQYRSLYSSDEGFRQTVRELELWLAPLNEDVPDLAPPEGLLESILAEIEPPAAPSADVHTPIFGGASASANDNRSGGWKALSAVTSLIAIAAVGSHFVNLEKQIPLKTPRPAEKIVQVPAQAQQEFLALLSDDTKPELVAIIYNAQTGKVVASLSNITVPEDGDLQLWLIREGEAAPQSLGVLERARTESQFEFEIPAQLKSGTDILAISLEQKGGSPSAGPEGQVLFTGAVAQLRRDI